ncbi:Zinc finger CCHC-type protein [Dioscorea alata]|uniref:Zinc finger CCHC-type protein n=1 Tax=Dioscorea alata TaxID=55571 RepID=A0ACB7UAI9_DIOAL|nr:Zinc finger CCHC-type protein [Dioscorea alata]
MELLRDLWSDSGGGDSGAVAGDDGKKRKVGNIATAMTYAEVVDSSSSDGSPKSGDGARERLSKVPLGKFKLGDRMSGAKRPRSPTEVTCGRCFRTTHKTADCRHQVVCLKCACVGHMAARCPVIRSPHRKRLHVRSKKLAAASSPLKAVDSHTSEKDAGPQPGESRELVAQWRVTRASVSLSLSPDSEKLREDLGKVVVLSLLEGNVNATSILEVAPAILNVATASPITPLTDCSFLVPLASRQQVKEVCKLGRFNAATKDGQCLLSIATWSAEFGVEGRASGRG